MSWLLMGVILTAVSLNVVGQILLKWRLGAIESLPSPYENLFGFSLAVLTDPFIVLSVACVFFAAFLWMVALSKAPLSLAYPFMGLGFVMILFLSVLIFNESLDLYKILGVLLISGGVWVSALSS